MMLQRRSQLQRGRRRSPTRSASRTVPHRPPPDGLTTLSFFTCQADSTRGPVVACQPAASTHTDPQASQTAAGQSARARPANEAAYFSAPFNEAVEHASEHLQHPAHRTHASAWEISPVWWVASFVGINRWKARSTRSRSSAKYGVDE